MISNFLKQFLKIKAFWLLGLFVIIWFLRIIQTYGWVFELGFFCLFYLWLFSLSYLSYRRIKKNNIFDYYLLCYLCFGVLITGLVVKPQMILQSNYKVIANYSAQMYGYFNWFVDSISIAANVAFLIIIILTARALVLLENQSKFSYWKTLLFALGIFVFPIGIWIIQPKAVRLLGLDSGSEVAPPVITNDSDKELS